VWVHPEGRLAQRLAKAVHGCCLLQRATVLQDVVAALGGESCAERCDEWEAIRAAGRQQALASKRQLDN
jgi:hypothetical protein